MRNQVYFILSIVVLISACLLAFNNNLKKKIHKAFLNKDKVILTTLSADLNNSGYPFRIVKIKKNNGIFLDLYQYDQVKGQHKKLDSIKLKFKSDGFYKFGKEATNLFTTDLNNDGLLEIIAPTHSPQLKPYLNIVNFNPQTKRLEFSPQSIFSF